MKRIHGLPVAALVFSAAFFGAGSLDTLSAQTEIPAGIYGTILNRPAVTAQPAEIEAAEATEPDETVETVETVETRINVAPLRYELPRMVGGMREPVVLREPEEEEEIPFGGRLPGGLGGGVIAQDAGGGKIDGGASNPEGTGELGPTRERGRKEPGGGLGPTRERERKEPGGGTSVSGGNEGASTTTRCVEGQTRFVEGGETKSCAWTVPAGNYDVDIRSATNGGYGVPGAENFLSELSDAFENLPGLPGKLAKGATAAGGEITRAAKRLIDKNKKQLVDVRVTMDIMDVTVQCAAAQECKKGEWCDIGLKPVPGGTTPGPFRTILLLEQQGVLLGEIEGVVARANTAMARYVQNQKRLDEEPCSCGGGPQGGGDGKGGGRPASPGGGTAIPGGGPGGGRPAKRNCEPIRQELEARRAQLADTRAALEQGRKELDQARREQVRAEEAWQRAKNEAQRELARAQAELRNAQVAEDNLLANGANVTPKVAQRYSDRLGKAKDAVKQAQKRVDELQAPPAEVTRLRDVVRQLQNQVRDLEQQVADLEREVQRLERDLENCLKGQ